MMVRRFAAGRIAQDNGNHALALVRSGLRARRWVSPVPSSAQAWAIALVPIAANSSLIEAVRMAVLIHLPSLFEVSLLGGHTQRPPSSNV